MPRPRQDWEVCVKKEKKFTPTQTKEVLSKMSGLHARGRSLERSAKGKLETLLEAQSIMSRVRLLIH